MKDERKPKPQLLKELESLRWQVAQLQTVNSQRKHEEEALWRIGEDLRRE